MSFVSEEVRQFLLQHPVLELTEGGKVRCTLTGHEVPCTLSAVKNFTEGKKYKRLSSCGSFDYSVYKPHIVPSNKNPKQLFCKLTVRHINRIPEHVQKHVQGKRYQRALAQYVECQKQGLQYVPPCLKNKKKPPRDRADKGPSGKKESWEAMDKESGDSDSGDSMSDLYPDHLFTKTTSAEPNGNTKRSGEEEAMEVEEESTQNKRKQEYSIMPHGGRKSKRPSGDQQRKAVHKAPGMRSAEEQEVEMSESGGVETEESESSESDASHSEDAVTERRIKEKALQSLSDVSFWEIPVPDHIRVEILKRESASFQNKDGPFGVSQRQSAKAEAKGDVRQLSKDWFYKEMPNGETILRSWMVYSPVSETLYCFCCRLFACSTTATTSKFVTGFQKWCKLSPEVNNHETSEDHLCCLEKWKTLAAGLKPRKTIDADTLALMKMEKKTWRDILHKLQPITLFLAERNLSFRDDDDYYDDDDEDQQSPLNKGNFLEMVEMLSNYDPVLKAHIVRLQESTVDPEVSAPYLAPQTQDEFISVLAKHVTEKLAADIKNAKYFGMVFDITPDRSHTYQMSEVIRYVQISGGKVEVKEVFLGLFSLKGKTAADLSSDILKKLENDGLDITMCRSQGYGHSTTMAGIHGGVRTILEEQNQKVIFNGCVDHSLALCGHHSFAANTSCIISLGTLERIFTFFAASSLRWDVLVNHTGVSVDRLSPTPWSAHYAAVKSVKDNFDDFVEAIEDLAAPGGNMDTGVEADLLLLSVYNFTFLCYLYFWCDVLQEVTLAQQYVQTKGLSLDKVVTKLETLQLFLYEERVHLSDHAVQQALLKSEEYEIDVERKTRVKSMAETSTDAGIPSLEEENRSGMLECIDRFHCELQIRSKAMMEVGGMFESIQAKSLICASEEELKVSIPKLTTFYDEVSESELLLEIPRLRRHLKAANINLDEAKEWATFEVLSFIAEWDFLESLPTLSLSLRLFLTVCVSVASCERSFSKLDVIKNHLRFTMYEPGLPDLAVLSVESEFAKDLNFDEAIDNFAALKARQTKF